MPSPTRPTQTQPQQELGKPARLTSGQQALTSHVPGLTGPHATLLDLQRTAGNQAVSQVIQAKLRENQRSNTSEQDAEQQLAAGSLTPSSAGRPLPEAVRQKMETAFGQDFSQVRIHEGPQAPSIGALAYTRGSDIHFAPGKYQPESASGQAVLSHELTHVVQQRAGRVQHIQGNGVAINVDPILEHEADVLGTKAAQGNKVQINNVNADLQPRTDSAPIQMLYLHPEMRKAWKKAAWATGRGTAIGAGAGAITGAIGGLFAGGIGAGLGAGGGAILGGLGGLLLTAPEQLYQVYKVNKKLNEERRKRTGELVGLP